LTARHFFSVNAVKKMEKTITIPTNRIGPMLEIFLKFANLLCPKLPPDPSDTYTCLDISQTGCLRILFESSGPDLGSIEFSVDKDGLYRIKAFTLRHKLEGTGEANFVTGDLDRAADWVVAEIHRLAEAPTFWNLEDAEAATLSAE
jgi:hypothetical protein